MRLYYLIADIQMIENLIQLNEIAWEITNSIT